MSKTTSFWVKAYDCYNRLSVNPNYNGFEDGRNGAYAEFSSKRDSGKFTFVQMGAWTTDGSIVINEWRAQPDVTLYADFTSQLLSEDD